MVAVTEQQQQQQQPAEPPKTMMRAAQAVAYGRIDDVLSVQSNVAIPRLKELSAKKQKNQMVVQTHTVALAPGDVRVLSGKTQEIQGPAELPYIPAGDCCGTVVELPPDTEKDDSSLPFSVGDRVAVRFCGKNYDALADQGLVPVTVAAKVPDNLSSMDAAALASSAAPAYLMAQKYCQQNEQSQTQEQRRVLVLGAGGGVGSHLCQLLRLLDGRELYIVGVSQTPDRLVQSPIGCDAAVDYTQQNVFEMTEYQENPFDIIFDLAGGGYQQLEQCVEQGQGKLIVKSGSEGGRFVTTVPPIGPVFDGHSIWGILKVFLFPVLWKVIKSRAWTRKQLPLYSFALALDEEREHLVKTLDLASSGKLHAVVDPRGPFPFTTEGVRDAFRLQESRHPQGKVIVRVADEK